MSSEPEHEVDEDFAGRSYTRGMRAPTVHGSVPGGPGRPPLRIPGGPYSTTQLLTLGILLAALIATRDTWGGHGLVDALVVLGVPFGAALALRHVHIDGRNPLSALFSIALLLTGPAHGRLHDKAWRPPRPRRLRARTQLAPAPGTPPDPAIPRTPLPAPAPVPAASQPVTSGVQALLARRSLEKP